MYGTIRSPQRYRASTTADVPESVMVKRKPLESRQRALNDIPLVPAVARLPAAAAAERRDLAARQALVRRIHGEFQEMPGLTLTVGQATKLFGLSPEIASRILDRLAEARVLHLTRGGRFAPCASSNRRSGQCRSAYRDRMIDWKTPRSPLLRLRRHFLARHGRHRVELALGSKPISRDQNRRYARVPRRCHRHARRWGRQTPR